MYIWYLLKFWEAPFCRKLTKPCRHSRTVQLVSQQSLASINNKNLKILKQLPVATIVPSGTLHHRWGIDSDLWFGLAGSFGSLIQARAILPPFWGSAHPVTTDSPYLQLYRIAAYIHHLCLYAEITAKEGVLFEES